MKLLGGDASFHALFLENIDARDLSHEDWCNRKTDRKFRGTPAQAQCILYDIARALQYLRREKILHNDIKPPNILFNGKKAVLIDFGIGTFDGSRASNGGTPWYVAPEYSNIHERKAPSDIWALGIVMLFALRRIGLPDTGVDVPSWIINDVGTVGPARAQMVRWIQIVEREAQKVKAEDGELGGIVSRMLHQRARQRITADELVSAIEALMPRGSVSKPLDA